MIKIRTSNMTSTGTKSEGLEIKEVDEITNMEKEMAIAQGKEPFKMDQISDQHPGKPNQIRNTIQMAIKFPNKIKNKL